MISAQTYETSQMRPEEFKMPQCHPRSSSTYQVQELSSKIRTIQTFYESPMAKVIINAPTNNLELPLTHQESDLHHDYVLLIHTFYTYVDC